MAERVWLSVALKLMNINFFMAMKSSTKERNDILRIDETEKEIQN